MAVEDGKETNVCQALPACQISDGNLAQGSSEVVTDILKEEIPETKMGTEAASTSFDEPEDSKANGFSDSPTVLEALARESTCVVSYQSPSRTEATSISANDSETVVAATVYLAQTVADDSSPSATQVKKESPSHRPMMSPLGGAKGVLLLAADDDAQKEDHDDDDATRDARDRPSIMSDYQSCDGDLSQDATNESGGCANVDVKELVNVAAWVDSTTGDNETAEGIPGELVGEDQDDPINFNSEKWVADQQLQEELAEERDRSEKLRIKVEQLERVVQKMNTGRDEVEKSWEAKKMDMDRKIDELKEKNRRVREDLSKAKSETSNVRSLLQQQKRELAAVRDKLAAQGRKLVDSEGQNTLLKEQLEGLQQKMQQKLTRMHSELQALRKDKADVEVQVMELAVAQDEHLASFSTVFRSLSLIEEEKEAIRKKFFQEAEKRKKLQNDLIDLKGSIRVFCRARPLSEEEERFGVQPAVLLDADPHGSQMVSVRSAKDGQSKVFEFDRVFSPATGQAQVFKEAADVITSVLDGYNVCIFAYGQTGTGKTYTMEGPADNRGVSFRTLQELFRLAKERRDSMEYKIVVSVLEVYNDTIRDLLAPAPAGHAAPASKKGLEVKQRPEGGNYVPGLVEQEVGSVEEAWKVLTSGSKARATSATSMNEHSSRSHCLVCVSVHAQPAAFLRSSKDKEAAGPSGASAATVSRLWLVDLAGSERVAKSEAEGERLKEAQNINLSLSYLGEVINALAKRASFVNFRNCKLTMLLQDSLEGNAKVLMFVQVSPSEKDSVETVCSLQFACRVRGVDFGANKKHTDVPRLKQALEKAKADCKEVKEAYKKQSEELEEVRRRTATEKEKLVSELQMQIQERKRECQDLMDKLEQAVQQQQLQQAQQQQQQQQQAKADSSKQPSVSAGSLQAASQGPQASGAEEEEAEHTSCNAASLEQTSDAGEASASAVVATASSASAAAAAGDDGAEEVSRPRPESFVDSALAAGAVGKEVEGSEEEKGELAQKHAGDRAPSQPGDSMKGGAGETTGAFEKRVGAGRVTTRLPAATAVAGGSSQNATVAVTASGVPKAPARQLGSKIPVRSASCSTGSGVSFAASGSAAAGGSAAIAEVTEAVRMARKRTGRMSLSVLPGSRTGGAWGGLGKGERRREAWDDYAMLGYAPAAKKMMLRRATATDAAGVEIGERLERLDEAAAGTAGDHRASGTGSDVGGAVKTRKPGRPPLAGLRTNKVVVGREWYDEWRRQSADVSKGLKRNPNATVQAAAEGAKKEVCDGESVDASGEKKSEEGGQAPRLQQLVQRQHHHVFAAGSAAASAAAAAGEATAPAAHSHGIPPIAFGSSVRQNAMRKSGLTAPTPSALPSLQKMTLSGGPAAAAAVLDGLPPSGLRRLAGHGSGSLIGSGARVGGNATAIAAAAAAAVVSAVAAPTAGPSLALKGSTVAVGSSGLKALGGGAQRVRAAGGAAASRRGRMSLAAGMKFSHDGGLIPLGSDGGARRKEKVAGVGVAARGGGMESIK
ncbi:hypothetical protein CLOM_g16721 [Closterium sp. NIES-68]|nr:hypothetical protein CLOM_g16721 [Closterium sp. NIES-68]GJP66609.1 hypothetical protein CLOP_g23524 [Closterium sp. NIES-67]